MKYAEILHRCFRCGYCKLPGNYMDFNCPAYTAFRFETYSPGGRMWLLRAWLDHKLEPSRRFQEILFSCTACRNCVEQCTLPKIKDELLLAFTAGKSELVGEGKVPPAVRDCLTNLQKYGNPYGIPRKKRTHWAADAEVELFSDQDYLFFPGDVGSFDSQGQEIARSVATLLTRLGISFGILGEAEVSDGNEANAMGESELFRLLAEENIKHFNELNVKRIIALSPHGFNALCAWACLTSLVTAYTPSCCPASCRNSRRGCPAAFPAYNGRPDLSCYRRQVLPVVAWCHRFRRCRR